MSTTSSILPLNIILAMVMAYPFTCSNSILFQGAVYGFAVSGLHVTSMISPVINVNNMWNGGSFGLEGSIVTVFVMMVFTTFLYTFRNKSRQIQMATISKN